MMHNGRRFSTPNYSGVVYRHGQVSFQHRASRSGACVEISAILHDAELRPAVERIYREMTGYDAPGYTR